MAQEIADSKLLDTWGSSGTKIEPDISKIIEGWQLGEQPPHEYMNWLQNTFGSKLNHILKNGIAKWDGKTEYLAGASVQHSGSIWLCETTNTNSEPTGLNANWEKVAINKDLTVTVDTLADLKNISYPANTVWASGYHTKNDGAFGSHIFRLKGVKTTETDNGGKVIIATIGGVDYVYELQYDGAVNVKWFGAVGDGVTDDTAAIQAALDSGNNVFIPAGNYKITSQLTINSYNIVTGEGCESYGENDIVDKTSITVLKLTGFTAGQYGININGTRVQLRNLSIEGDYVGNGITIANLKRELILDQVSVKYIQVGIYSTSCHVANLQNVTVTAQDIGIDWNAGTTLNFSNVGIQGDPEVGRINTGLRFSGSLSNAKMCGGFVQHMITAVEISGQNVIEFDSWDFEDLVNDATGSIFKLGTCNNGSLSINNCNGVAGTAPEGQSIFRIIGAIGNYFPIDIGTFYHFITASGKLINFDGGSLASKFRMMSYYYSKHSPQFGASVDPQSHIAISDTRVYDEQSYSYITSLTNVAIPLKNADGTDYDFDKGAIVNVTVYGTSTDNTSCTYAVGRNGNSLYKLTHLAGNSVASSNRPYMTIVGGVPQILTNNVAAFPAKVSVHGI